VITATLPTRLLGLLALGATLSLAGCGTDDSGTSGTSGNAQSSASSAGSASGGGNRTCANVAARTDDFHQQVALTTTTADGLKHGDIVAGSGAAAAAGNTVTMQYTGWLDNGTMFDSSRSAGRQPFDVTDLGNGPVIKGWNEGIVGMKLGGVRRLVIPPALGYGAGGSPPVIPPNATLTFDVQLLCITT